MQHCLIEIHADELDLAHWHKRASELETDDGAQVVFTGMVRGGDYDVPVTHLFIEHYPSVTENEIQKIVQAAAAQWPISSCIVLHRVGKIHTAQPIVWVMTQSRHRAAAYAANEFIMDYLKVAAPFWKKECFADGTERWVAAKNSDRDKYRQWLS